MRAHPNLLVHTDVYDPHADYLIPRFQERGVGVFRLNTRHLPSHIRFEFHGRPGGESMFDCVQLATGRRLSSSEVDVVWNRRPGNSGLSSALPEQEYLFASGELDQLRRAFLAAATGATWFNRPEDDERASLKLTQLEAARKVGLRVPESFLVNGRAEFVDLVHSFPRHLVFKTLSGSALAGEKLESPPVSPRVTRTTLMTREMVESIPDDESFLVPCFVQECIPKQCDIRVTIIRQRIVSVRVHSQEDPRTVTDWRHPTYCPPLSPCSLPDDTCESLLRLNASYGLNFSAIDLILAENDELLFVDLNPKGQFLFIEDRCPEAGIASAFIEGVLDDGQ